MIFCNMLLIVGASLCCFGLGALTYATNHNRPPLYANILQVYVGLFMILVSQIIIPLFLEKF